MAEKVLAFDFVKEVGAIKEENGIAVDKIPSGGVLVIRVLDRTYSITVSDIQENKVRIEADDGLFAKPETCRLNGSTWGGHALKMNWIGLGMYLELVRNEETIITIGPVSKITLMEEPDQFELTNKPTVQ